MRELIARAIHRGVGFYGDYAGMPPGSKEQCDTATIAVLDDLEAAGFVIVPKEPTEGMLKEGLGYTLSAWGVDDRSLLVPIWQAMIDAAKNTAQAPSDKPDDWRLKNKKRWFQNTTP